jgi:hypothetical protein
VIVAIQNKDILHQLKLITLFYETMFVCSRNFANSAFGLGIQFLIIVTQIVELKCGIYGKHQFSHIFSDAFSDLFWLSDTFSYATLKVATRKSLNFMTSKTSRYK